MTKITRIEVIDENGRSYVNWEDDNDVSWQFQDDGRTLKVFVNKVKPKTPVEEAYKNWWGEYPGTEIWTDYDETRWVGFKAGYNAAYEEKVSEWEPTPQTPEQVSDGLKEAFREAIKQGIIPEVDKVSDEFMDEMVAKLKGQTLTDIIWNWWGNVFTSNEEWDAENCIEHLVDLIEAFLPKPQNAAGSQNAYVECSVEGFNDCLNTIKRKLR